MSADGLNQRRTGTHTTTVNARSSSASGAPTAATAAASSSTSYFSSNASKRRGEIFFLGWGAVWISIMAFIVATRWFEDFTPTHYMVTGLVIALPPMILPLLFPGSDASIPWAQRYTTKANVWIFILSWMANYFWTHYFYQVLGATYTFAAWRLNDVPFALYLITHSYFHFYHVLSNMALRLTWRRFGSRVSFGSLLAVTAVIVGLSYFMAFMETFTIQNFPYYHIPDRTAMYVYGCMFYALYFIVSFPMFLRMDETPDVCWSLERATIDALAASMLITQLLDFWRIWIGPIVDLEEARKSALKVLHKDYQAPPIKPVPFVY